MNALLPDSDSEDELPPGWEERTTLDNSVYFVNHTTKGSQWTHPRTGKKKRISGEMPFGWEKCLDEENKVFYVDRTNNRTTYTDPRLAFATEEKEHPNDFRQRFDGSSTALQVLHGKDLSGKVAVVTGANSGIGFETARSLAFHGCTVVFACRNLVETEAGIAKIRSERSQVNCDMMFIDLQSLQTVYSFAVNFQNRYKKLDILILNAGIFGIPFSLTKDGYETTFQVNHLSQFYLTLLLEPQLTAAKSPRVVILSSESHRFSALSLDNMTELSLSPKTNQYYWAMSAYNDSKLCNVLFAVELARRWERKNVAVFAVHPGNMMSTSLSRYWWLYRIAFALVRPFTKSMQQGASTSVYCATAHELIGCTGLYFNNCCRCTPSKLAQDPALAARLWDISTEMITVVRGKEATAFASNSGK